MTQLWAIQRQMSLEILGWSFTSMGSLNVFYFGHACSCYLLFDVLGFDLPLNKNSWYCWSAFLNWAVNGCWVSCRFWNGQQPSRCILCAQRPYYVAVCSDNTKLHKWACNLSGFGFMTCIGYCCFLQIGVFCWDNKGGWFLYIPSSLLAMAVHLSGAVSFILYTTLCCQSHASL